MTELKNAHTHIYRYEPILPAEEQILAEFVRPGMRVLDVGCAATGRSARMLRRFDCEVHSIEINPAAIREFSHREDSQGIHLAVADVTCLPFADSCFELVLIAFHGLDYLVNLQRRATALQEVNRVLAPEGRLMFNAFNRVGLVLTPQGLFSPAYLKKRLQLIYNGAFLKRSFVDVNQLALHQAIPRTIIREVERYTDLEFRFATNASGSSRNLALLTLFATAPYYVFARQG